MLPVPFHEVHLRLISFAMEQVSAVFKDIFNLVWPEEQGAVQFDILFCKTHTVGFGHCSAQVSMWGINSAEPEVNRHGGGWGNNWMGP